MENGKKIKIEKHEIKPVEIHKTSSSLVLPMFTGKIIHTMPELLTRGYTPISAAGIMDLINNVFESDEDELIAQLYYKNSSSGDGLVSGDGLIYHKKTEDVKIVLNSPNLRKLTKKSKLEYFSNGCSMALNLEQEKGAKRFDDFPDEDPKTGVQLFFTKKEQEEYFNKNLTEKQVIKNLGWLALARGNEDRLGTYVENIFSKIKEKHKFMGVNIPSKKPISKNEKYLFNFKPDFEAEIPWVIRGPDSRGNYAINYYGLGKYHKIGLIGADAAKIDLESLMGDFKTLSDKGYLNPKTQALYEALQNREYNL